MVEASGGVPVSLERPRGGRLSPRLKSLRRFVKRQPLGAVSAVFLCFIVLVAFFPGVFASYDPKVINTGPPLSSVGSSHWFGTDNFGRDVYSRVIWGTRVSLYVGIGATLIGVALATVIGIVSGYAQGLIDYLLQRMVDATQAVPPIILLIAVIVILGPSATNVVIALSARGALTMSRIVRGEVLALRRLPFIEAAGVLGANHVRIMLVHLLPNVLPTAIVLVSVNLGANIVAEASLSFLGYGVPPPSPTWGGMMSAEGRLYMLVNPWILAFPTAALAAVVFATNMFGDALRDEIDPRLRTRG